MARRQYTVAVIGCGQVGARYNDTRSRTPRTHAAAASRLSSTKLIALVDTNPAALAAAGKRYPKVPRYRSAAACFAAQRPDIVVIATPTRVRLSLIKQCIAAGVRTIVCEKPLAATSKEAQAIARLVRAHKINFVLNYQRRFSPLVESLRHDIISGKLGRIQQVTCYYSNGLYNNGGHALDTMSYLLGGPLRVVWAAANHAAMHPKGDMCIDAVLEGPKGARVVLQSVDQHAYGIFDIRVLGSAGERALVNYSETLVATPVHTLQFAREGELDRAHARTSKGAPRPALEVAVDALARRKRPVSDAVNGVEVLKLVESIRNYAKTKKG